MYPADGSGVGTGDSQASLLSDDLQPRPSGPAPGQGDAPSDAVGFPTPAPEPLQIGESQGERLRLSFSKLSGYSDCGEKYRLRFIEQVPTIRSGAAIAGQAVHEVIDAMVREGWFIDPAAVEADGTLLFIEIFNAKLDEAGGTENVRWGGRKRQMRDENNRVVKDAHGKPVMVGEDYQWMCHNAPTWIKRAGAILRDDVMERGAEIADVMTEIRVSCWLDEPGGVLVTGAIDHLMLLRNERDEYRIRDFKTGAFSPDRMQLAAYSWMLMRGLNLEATYGEFAKLRGRTKDDWLVSYDLRPLLPVIERMYHDAVVGIEAGHFQLKPSAFCASCDVRPACPYGSQLEVDA
jgi:hypothetical protein